MACSYSGRDRHVKSHLRPRGVALPGHRRLRSGLVQHTRRNIPERSDAGVPCASVLGSDATCAHLLCRTRVRVSPPSPTSPLCVPPAGRLVSSRCQTDCTAVWPCVRVALRRHQSSGAGGWGGGRGLERGLQGQGALARQGQEARLPDRRAWAAAVASPRGAPAAGPCGRWAWERCASTRSCGVLGAGAPRAELSLLIPEQAAELSPPRQASPPPRARARPHPGSAGVPDKGTVSGQVTLCHQRGQGCVASLPSLAALGALCARPAPYHQVTP